MGQGQPDPVRQAVLGFLLRYRNERTRRAYASDLADFTGWCADHGLDPLRVGAVHVEAYARHTEEVERLAVSTVARRLTTLSRFYRAAVIDGHLDRAPTDHVTRPEVDSESPTLGLDRGRGEMLAGRRPHLRPA